ncbi:Planctomycete cytochrome C [Gemmata sp. SH-PL17]|uniref:PSD1 and planctomycete cytochrome C domain-containing protein n=1 Tax=Gemmata sp. SH-PL17 TaxID=1630693 RepID=UPI00078DBD73|nr:PSD1 and planctomycete cytochrome C domain-containing protein [Gemmata sp. SH-PL17]AMV25357.1 Planctomycete cytochrome C [Gemmata sp. SH-PL17]
MCYPSRWVVAFVGLLGGAATTRGADPTDHFEAKVRPVLVQHCIKCHGPEKQKSGLRLDSKTGWQTGGESGPALVPGKSAESLLIKALSGADGISQMPPNGKLTAAEIAALEQWVKDGAVDPRVGGPARLGGVTAAEAKDWWSFRPVTRPAVPKNAGTNAIDAFIRAKLAGANLALSPTADKRTLIRRATYDLTGLPPTPQDIKAFLKDDSPEAFAKVVDRLLASPAYGERWGRHWLDLVRYADTAGENSDHPLPHAWRYRNWVIDAVNRDVPYDEFLRDQLAGDIVAAQNPNEKYAPRVVATGFLALARRFGHDIDKDIHLTYEDTIDTVGKAFLGLTIGCARCHDHKYDAITAKDYYALYGILDSTKFAFPGCEPQQRPRDLVPLMPPAEWDRVVKPYKDKLANLDAQLAHLRAEQTKLAQELKARAGTTGRALARGEIPDGGEQVFDKLPAEIEVRAGQFLQLSVTPLKNHGADSTLIEWDIAEIGGKERRWNLTADVLDDLLAGNPHGDTHGNKRVWWFLDTREGPIPLSESARDLSGKPGLNAWRNGDTPSVFANCAKEPVPVWTKLPARSVFVHPGPNGNVAVGWLSPVDGKIRITGRIKDAHPGGPDGVGWVLERFTGEMGTDLLTVAGKSEKQQALERERAALIASAPVQDVAFAVTESTPHNAKVHLRGDPEKLGPVVPRRWLEVFGGEQLPALAGSGRLELAGWITAKNNPLTARVMVNRIWLHHFGKGLVKTPNDFGTRGSAPSHPELLDWLASEFVEKQWSVKALHRQIMLSATYQQASTLRPDAAKVDANNELYWRFERRRLSGEELRDSLLTASGQLDRKPGGAHPFPPEASWSYSQHVPFSTFFESDKRSVYLISVRNRRHPFLGLFDGADPNATTPQRQDTTVPTQALYFLNDPFFHGQSEKVASRALTKPEAARLDELFRAAFQRTPTNKEQDAANAFLKRYAATLTDTPPAERTKAAWAALARVLLASNEFLYLD